jgi:signal transduction histidine kinase
MLRGKVAFVYSIMKIAFYSAAVFEYLYYYQLKVPAELFIMVFLLIVNNFCRQLFLYGKEKLHRFEKGSIILEFVLGVYVASLLPVAPVVLLLTPAVFESISEHSLLFGAGTSLAALGSITAIDIVDTLQSGRNNNFYNIFQNVIAQYALAYILIIIISYLASLQFRERARIAKVNLELEEAYRQLVDNASKLQELSIEKERNRMAREIHDTLAHTLTAAVVQMEAGKKLIDIDTSRAKAEIEKAQEITRDGIGDVKRTVKALRPQILENNSLCGAIRSLIRNIEDSAHIKVELHENFNTETENSFCSDTEFLSCTEVVIFRVIQESITNAIRHGNADKVAISMTEKDGMLNIDIQDNGKGCAHIKEGYGLKGITERVRGRNGTVYFSSAAGKGFDTHVTIPYKRRTADEDQGDDRR